MTLASASMSACPTRSMMAVIHVLRDPVHAIDPHSIRGISPVATDRIQCLAQHGLRPIITNIVTDKNEPSSPLYQLNRLIRSQPVKFHATELRQVATPRVIGNLILESAPGKKMLRDQRNVTRALRSPADELLSARVRERERKNVQQRANLLAR